MPNQATYESLEQRFWSKVDPCRTDGCAVWLGMVDRDGYGAFWRDGRMTRAHHFLVGPTGQGLEWDHVKERGCANRNCVWPNHLEAVTHAENMRRGNHIGGDRIGAFHRAKTHCRQGHPFNDENTYHRAGHRHCRECNRAAVRKYQATGAQS